MLLDQGQTSWQETLVRIVSLQSTTFGTILRELIRILKKRAYNSYKLNKTGVFNTILSFFNLIFPLRDKKQQVKMKNDLDLVV